MSATCFRAYAERQAPDPARMLFHTLPYFLFLPIVYLLFYFVRDRARWSVLLAASIFFYASLNEPYLLGVLFTVVMITYGFGRAIGQAKSHKARLSLLWTGIATDVLILIFLKYTPYFAEGLDLLSKLLSFDLRTKSEILVTIGVSYYIFQAVSYLIDIYLEIIKPEKHLGYFALSLAFFPKLLQGPIERSGNLLPQLKAKYDFNYENMCSGVLLFTWGLFKKVVIADRLDLYVKIVYNNVHGFKSGTLLLATYAYALQIFMDFSGYTDMALGTARLFNIQLTQNFNKPYFATSVADFWRRWHISFSSWILDYIFKPLQMQWRNAKHWGTAAALIITFLVSGIWHGATWGFVIWGLLHGIYLAVSVFYRPAQKKLYSALRIKNAWGIRIWRIFVTFNLVSFAWVFFRANNLPDALYLSTHMFGFEEAARFLKLQGMIPLIMTAIPLLAYAGATEWYLAGKGLDELKRKNRLSRYIFYNLLILMIFFFGEYSGLKQFVYFEF